MSQCCARGLWRAIDVSAFSWCKKCVIVDLLTIFWSKMTNSKADQRAEIRFCVKSGLTRRQTLEKLTAVHGANTLSKSQVNKWFAKFATGDDNIKDQPRNATPRTATPAKVQAIRASVVADWRSTLRSLAAQHGVAPSTVHRVLHKSLDLKKRSAHWIPHLLTPDEKRRRIDCARRALALL